MTLIDDTLAIDRDASQPLRPERAPDHDRSRPSRRRRVIAAGTALVLAGGLAVAVIQSTASNERGAHPLTSSAADRHTVVGTGPDAVYVGPSREFGGEPIYGETDRSYFGRTGHHLPGHSSATQVDGEWWHGPAPVHGGDPVPGETDASYFARTGHHLPIQFSPREQALRDLRTRELVARGLIPAATLDEAPSHGNIRSSAP